MQWATPVEKTLLRIDLVNTFFAKVLLFESSNAEEDFIQTLSNCCSIVSHFQLPATTGCANFLDVGSSVTGNSVVATECASFAGMGSSTIGNNVDVNRV